MFVLFIDFNWILHSPDPHNPQFPHWPSTWSPFSSVPVEHHNLSWSSLVHWSCRSPLYLNGKMHFLPDMAPDIVKQSPEMVKNWFDANQAYVSFTKLLPHLFLYQWQSHPLKGRKSGWRRAFSPHCLFLSLCCVLPRFAITKNEGRKLGRRLLDDTRAHFEYQVDVGYDVRVWLSCDLKMTSHYTRSKVAHVQ